MRRIGGSQNISQSYMTIALRQKAEERIKSFTAAHICFSFLIKIHLKSRNRKDNINTPISSSILLSVSLDKQLSKMELELGVFRNLDLIYSKVIIYCVVQMFPSTKTHLFN
jgi:hypothetical protein